MIYLLIKLEQSRIKDIALRPLSIHEIVVILPIYLLPLNIPSFLLLCCMFVLTWMDYRIQSISDRLIIIYFLCILAHYVTNPIPIDLTNLFICSFLFVIALLTKGFGLGDVYILFGLALILNFHDFTLVLQISFIIALIIESIKKTKVSFAFIPYIYYSMILFLSVNLCL